MSNDEKRVWGIHTTDDSLFLHNNTLAIGWKEFGDYGSIEPTREAFKDHYCKAYPNAKKGAIATSAGMLYRFMMAMRQIVAVLQQRQEAYAYFCTELQIGIQNGIDAALNRMRKEKHI